MSQISILQIETSSNVCSVALAQKGVCIDEYNIVEPNMHATKLTLLIESILKRNGLLFSDLSAIAVSMGPGSYTGLRIGVSSAKGLCYALDKPLIGISTLQSMFEGYKGGCSHDLSAKVLYCPMIDARRMEVYSCLLDNNGNAIVPTAANIIDEHSFLDYLHEYKEIHLFGTGADKLKALFGNNRQIVIKPDFQSTAAYMSALAYDAFVCGSFEDTAYFEPYYLKDFIPTAPKNKKK